MAVAAPAAWRAVQRAGLPDVGGPFDDAAFRPYRIPNGRYAFVACRRAVARYRPMRRPPERAKLLEEPGIVGQVATAGEAHLTFMNGVLVRQRLGRAAVG